MCVVIVFWSAAFFLAHVFGCGTHMAYLWTSPATLEEHCVNLGELSLGFGVSDVLTDIMTLAIPIPIVWKLQLSMANKFCLMGIFLLGLL